MSIKLKPSTSNSDQFYPLDDRSLSNGKREGANAGAGIKEVRSKLTSFSKNILKSTKNLAFDVTNEYVPNAKEVKDSFKETVASAQEDFNKNFGPLIQKAKQFLHGATGKEGSEGLKAKISKQAKEIKDRLKSGKLYTSMDEEIEASFGFGDDDFSFDDSDFNLGDNSNSSYTEVAEPDSLSEEPFGGVKKGKTRKVNITNKQKQLKQRSTPMKRQVKKPIGGTASNQLSLGDELVSNTTGLVGQNVIAKQEEIWARTNDAQEKRFSKLYGYQNQILKGINSLVDYNNNIDSQNVRAQMEFQGKMLAAQQDSLAELKELKDSIMVLSTYNAGKTKESLNAKISNSPIGLNGKAYWENIKKNLKDVAGSNPILSSLAMAPMMGDMMSMTEDTGMKVVNPLNMATKGLFSMFLSKNTKNRLMDFNDLLSNFGGLFTGKMNMLARYGKGPAKTIGRILGARESTVSVINNGLDDPNAVTGWTSKSDRTLNEVIPTLLAKQLAVISGKDELIYDYKDGKFKTSKAIKEEVNLRKKMAYENADTVRYTDAMASFISTNKNTVDLNNSLGGSKNVSEYIKKIANNLIKTGQMWDPDLAGFNDQYRESLLDGIPSNAKDNALKAFSTAYNQMSAKETLRFNGAIRKVNMGLQQRLDSINNDYKTFGGASAVVESGLEEQIEEKKRSMKFDLSMQLSQKEIDDAKAGRPSAHYIQVQNERMRRNMEIRKLESTLDKGGVTAEVEGFGEVSGLGSSGGTAGGIPSAIDKIFRLLAIGVPVYNQGPILPDKLIKLRSKLGALDRTAAKNRQDEINSDKKFEEDMMASRNKLYEDQVRFKRNQRVMQQNFMSYILPTGNSSWQQTNIINRGANKLIDASSGAFGKLIGSGYGHGEGLLGDISYAEIDRQNIQNAINAFTKQKEKLQKQIEETKDDPKAARKNKFKQKLVDLLDKQIEKNKQRLDSISNGKDDSEENAKVNDFNNSLSKFVDSFSNRFIMQTHEINPNDPSLKQQFGDIFAKGKEIVKENNIFLKVQSDAINAKNEISDKLDSIKGKYPSVKDDIVGAATRVKETTLSTGRNIQHATKRANKIIETIKRYNITSAEEFRKISENNPVLKKYNFLVSKLFSTGAIKVQDGKPVITSRANTIIGIFVKRESEGKTTTVAVPTKDNLGLAVVGDTVPIKTKVEPKEISKAEITKKTSGVNAKYSSDTSGVIVGEDGTVVDNSGTGSQKFKEYSGLKTTLALNGYENAYKLSNDDLYALVTSIKGPQGDAIRSTTDYRLLKRRTETKIKDKAKKDDDETSKSGKKQKKIKDPTDPWFFYYPLMLKNGTLRYRKLLQLLQPKIGQSVYNFDKESLFAMITALPTRTGDDENFKAVLTRTKEFQHLKSHFKMGLVDKVKNVFDVKRNFRRATSGIRLFGYRHLLRILDMMNLGEDDGFFRNKLDDKYALKAIIEGLGTSSDKKKQLVYNSIVMTKEYMKLSRATVTGKSRKEIREKRKAIKHQWKAGNTLQRKYGNLISVLRLSGARGNNFDYSKLSEVELYNLAKAFALRKDHNTGELLHASILQMTEFKELQKKCENKKIDFSKLGTKTKEFFEEVTDSAAQSIGGPGTPQMSEVVNYLKVMAADSWKNLTGKIRSFTNAASNGFKNLAKEAENEDHEGSGGTSKSIKYTARSVGNILSLLYATLISGRPEDINRTKLMNMQNIDLDNIEDAEVISTTTPERKYKTQVKLNTSIKLGGKIAKKYPKLTSALFEMGYADAPTMKAKDMYALIVATKGRKGIALRNVDEFEKLEQEASTPTLRGRIVSTAKAIGRKIQTGWKIAKLLAHKMLPYKSLVETLDQALNSDKTDAEKIDVFDMDKYSLYAAITTLPMRLRSIIMKSTPFSKLSRAVNAGKSWIRSTVEDTVKTVKKKIIRFKSFKYRYLIDFLRLQGYDGHDENHQDAALIKDPAELYLMLDAWGSLKKNHARYNILRQSKSFKNLEKAVNRQNARKEKGPLMPKVLRRTGNTIRNGISSLYSKFISGKSDDINRTTLMNMQNIDMDDRPSIFGRMKQRIGDFSDKIAGSDSKIAGKFGLIKDSDIITTVTKNDKTKVKTAVDQSKNQMMANAGKRIFQKTKNIQAALLGTIAAGLTNLNKVQSSMAYFLGMNDKGEVDEKRKESLVGQLHDDLGNVKGGGDGSGGGGGFWKDLLGNLGADLIKKVGVKNLLKFGVGAAALTASGIGIYKTAKKTSKLAKEQGAQSAIGYALGVDPTNQDNSSWVNFERAGNVKTNVKKATMGGGIKLVKETAKTGKDIVVTGKNSVAKTIATKAGKEAADDVAEGAVKVAAKKGLRSTVKATATAAKTAAADAIKSIPQQISKIITKFLNSPKLIKKFGKTAIQTLRSLPEIVAKKFNTFLKGGIKGAKNAAKSTAKKVGKSVGQAVKAVPYIGWALAIGDAIWEAAAGANDAGQYFNVLPKDVTTGMRVASGVANGVFSVVQSLLSITGVGTAIAIGLEIIIPKDWLVQTIYKLCANKADEEELKQKQEIAKKKAEAFGTDAEELTKAENVSLFNKGFNRVKSLFSKKSYKELNEETTAKKLGMSREEYLAKNTVYDLSNEFSQYNSGSFKDKYPLFATLTSPQAAQQAFNDPVKYKQAEAEALKMFKLKDMEAIYTVYKNIHDTKLKRQDTDTNNLTPGFKTKVSKMLDTLKTNGIGLSINEAKRDPFTQFAYFSKGRADNATADAILKMAGFGGLSFWGGDNSINTKTLNSNHLGGNAVDFNINNLTGPQFHATVDLAKKMGIEPGATWGATDGYNGWDKPHFQNQESASTDPNATQLAAEGGIVGKLIGYAKDKTGQIQGKLNDFGSSLSAGAKIAVAKSKNYLENFGDKIHMRLNEGEMVLNKGQQLGLWNKIKEFERNTVDKIKAKGSNTLNSLTHEEDTLKLIDQVFEIQNKIYNEQTRHNKVAEDFFGAILKAVMSLAVAGQPKGGYKEEISQMSQDLINGALTNASGM